MGYIIILLFSLTGYYLLKKMIQYINNNEIESDQIVITKKGKYIVVGIIVISTTVLYSKFDLSNFLFYYLLFVFLITVSYIDNQKMIIYRFMNIYIFCLSILFLVVELHKGIKFEPFISGLLFSAIISVIINTFNLWGKGDRDLFIAISFFVSNINIGFMPFNYAIINIILAGSLSGVGTILSFIFLRKYNFNRKKAFAPYIAAATMLSIYLF